TPVNNQNNQSSYLGFNEGDEALFLLAERNRRQKPITETGILRKNNSVTNQDNSTSLIETEAVLIPDIDVEMGDNKGGNDN
ncbi:501_t:CDS:1, partial [Scutellospora calospora]